LKLFFFYFVTHNCNCSLETIRLIVNDLHYSRRFARWNRRPAGEWLQDVLITSCRIRMDKRPSDYQRSHHEIIIRIWE